MLTNINQNYLLALNPQQNLSNIYNANITKHSKTLGKYYYP